VKDETVSCQPLTRPRLSIVIPTYNRPEKFNQLLRSIANSSPKHEYEVIVVDDSSTSTIIDEDTKQSLGLRLHVVRNPTRSFISKAKNLGWRIAQGEYVFFIDDDNVLPKGTIETLESKLDNDPSIGALMPVVYYEKRPQIAWVYAAPFSKGRWGFELIARNTEAGTKRWPELLPTDALPNAFVIRRSILEQLGGFEESLPINSSCDFCQRVKNSGHGVYALTTAVIYHDVTPPGVPGYWAEHAAVDIGRRYYEVRDWFNLMSMLHQGESLLPVQELLRSLPFLIEVGLGVLMHPSQTGKRILPVYSAMLRGLIDGVRIAARPTNGIDTSLLSR
jgi:GT2 family glycosyltransferase